MTCDVTVLRDVPSCCLFCKYQHFRRTWCKKRR